MSSQDLKVCPGWRIARTAALPVFSDCTGVIPTYKRYDEVVRLLDAVVRLEDKPYEMVVIDGEASGVLGQKLKEWASNKRLPFDLVYAQSEPGLTLQRNAGIDLTTAPYVFYFDDDTVPQPGYFHHMRRIFVEDRKMEIGGIGAAITNEMDKPIPRRWALRYKFGLVPRDLPPMQYYPSCIHVPRGLLKMFTGVKPADVIPGGATAWRREVLEKCRFSEYFKGYSQGEDLEMSLRVGKDWKLVCCGDAHILHLHASGGRPRYFRRGRMDVVNRYFIWKRHTPDVAFRYKTLFWGDIAFLIGMELVWFVARPWRAEPLVTASGMVAGVLKCLFRPPRFEEPPPRRHYVLNYKDQAQFAVGRS